MSFSALVTRKDASGAITSAIEMLDEASLPEGNVTVDIDWAGLNYKDGLCLTGRGGLVRSYPHVAGIDFAGRVSASDDPSYAPGQNVVLTGWGVGESHWGGYAQKARLNADWLVPLPRGLSPRDAMIVGTAGFSAMLAIEALERAGLVPGAGRVLVTGASGGVGSIAVALLSRLGHEVVALSGRPEHAEVLQRLGASSILARDEFLTQPDKPLESARYAAAIDNVGGSVLSKLLKQIHPGGAVAAVGNAGGIGIDTTVLPFILRGVSLLGINSVTQSYATRITTWKRIAESFDLAAYGGLVSEIGLTELPEKAQAILNGQVRGRVVIRPG